MKSEHRVIAISILFGLFAWALKIALDYFFPHTETFSVYRFALPVHEIYVLAATVGGFLVFGLLAAGAISRRRRAEEALRQRTVELQARNEELDAFAHTVAHDLKAVLQSIVGFAGALLECHTTIPEDKVHDILHKIARGGHKMSSIVDELLLLSEVRKVDGEARPLDMANIVAEVRLRLAGKIEEYQAEIVSPETWPVAMGHGPWVEEVWANYLDNALKYGGQPPCIELGAEEQLDGLVRFWVRDNGSGIPPEDQARLFAPFTRFDRIRARGYGLGLSIVRRIVEKLGGQVGVESVAGQGSAFFFTLPGLDSN